jgi:hypothetical protein
MKNKILSASLFCALLLFSCSNAPKNEVAGSPGDCTEYSCPMHPDHTSATPGKCPECDMQMEKVTKENSPADSTKAGKNE